MPDETRETAFPDDSRNAIEVSPGNAADDLSRLFADTPGKGENPVPASSRRRPGRRVLIVAACLAVPPRRPPPGRTEKPPVPLEGTPSFPYRAPGTACGLSRAPRKDALSPSGRAVPSPAAG